MSLKDLRRQYTLDTLNEDSLTEQPLDLFNQWLNEAIKADIPDPTAMTVATVDQRGQPAQRIVLLTQVDEKGFVFYCWRKQRNR